MVDAGKGALHYPAARQDVKSSGRQELVPIGLLAFFG
jgi:hypothetical protein